MITYPNLNRVAFHIGPVKVYWYGIMYLLGFAAAWWLARRRAAQSRSTWKKADVDDLIFFAGLTFWASDAWYPLRIWEGGMSFHGGLLGVAVALTLFAWRRGRHPADVYDFTVPLPALGLLFGRIGNFINSELWGKVTTAPWGFRVNGEVRHPSQLYEAALEGLLLFAVVWWFTARPRPRLAPSGLFLLVYGWSRFLVEFVRVPDEQIGYLAGGWLTEGQLLSAPMIIFGAALLVWAYRARAPSGNFAVAQ